MHGNPAGVREGRGAMKRNHASSLGQAIYALRLWAMAALRDFLPDDLGLGSFRIAMFRAGSFLRGKAVSVAAWVLAFLSLSAVVSFAFALVYARLLSLGWPPPPDVIRDSFLTFEGLPIFSGGGSPSFLSQNGKLLAESDVVWRVAVLEMVAGVVVNGCVIATVTTVALRPTNPIWIAPRVVLDCESTIDPEIHGTMPHGILKMSYWIRYPEGRLLHDVTIGVFLRPDRYRSNLGERDLPSFSTSI